MTNVPPEVTDAPPAPPKQSMWTPKRTRIVMLVLMAITGICTLAGQFGPSKAERQQRKVAEQRSEDSARRVAAGSSWPGLDVSADQVANAFDSAYHFTEGAKIRGERTYGGRNGAVSIQLIGPADNLSKAVIEGVVDHQSAQNALKTVQEVVTLVDKTVPDGRKWLIEQISNAVPNHPWTASREFDHKLLTIQYGMVEKDEMITVSVSPA